MKREIKPRKLKDSSKTRVIPFFSYLFKQYGFGTRWIPALLGMATRNQDIASMISAMNCSISIDKRNQKTADLVDRQQNWRDCFEYSIAPSGAFLRWLILNPEELTWPKTKGVENIFENSRTQQMRTSLIHPANDNEREVVQQYALHQIEMISNRGIVVKASKDKAEAWVKFEGYTRLDCLLETADFVLAIEGKRNEGVSRSIHWYPQRNQIVRNLEVLREYAGTKQYALILMNKDGTDPIKDADFVLSLPHMSRKTVQEISRHYLGSISWREACEVLNVPYSNLPDTVCDAIKK
jgi:hypothetical protein